VGRHGPDEDTLERTGHGHDAQQRQLAAAQQPSGHIRPKGFEVAERPQQDNGQALAELVEVTPEQVTRREVRFVRLAAVDQWHDRDPDGCRRLDRLSRREGR
jgi:hypothetical protein